MGIDSGNHPNYPGSDDPQGSAQPPLQPPAEPQSTPPAPSSAGLPYEPHPTQPPQQAYQPPQQAYQPPQQQPYQPQQPFQSPPHQAPPQQSPYQSSAQPPQQPYQSGQASYQQPQQGPYNQPPGSYEQQPGQQSGMGGQFTGGAYNPPPGYEAPPPPPGQKKGFNWLMCCGISCGVLLIIGILMMVLFGKMFKGFFEMGKEAEAVSAEVASTDIAAIQSAATYIDAPTLMSNPEAYVDEWLAVEGVISMNQQIANDAGGEGTNYVVDGGLIITDTSYNAPQGVGGETIVAYGKLMVIDMSVIPGMKQMLDEAAKTDPTVGSMFRDGKMWMFIAKEVHPFGMEGEPAEDPNAAGWSQ